MSFVSVGMHKLADCRGIKNATERIKDGIQLELMSWEWSSSGFRTAKKSWNLESGFGLRDLLTIF